MSNKSDGSYASTLANLTQEQKDQIAQNLEDVLVRRQRALATDMEGNAKTLNTLTDSQWAKHSFLVKAEELDAVDRVNRTFTRAAFKFNDSSLGGSYAINPRPQFTPYADIRAKSFLRATTPMSSQNNAGGDTTAGYVAGLGIGRYYSEAIDDNQQVIHMRFGVPQFNSLTTFFTGFFNSNQAAIARTGRGSLSIGGIAYIVGSAIGLVVTVLNVPLLLINAIGNTARFFFKKPSSKFYYLKPTMITYWSAVNSLVNQIGVNRGLYPKIPLLGDDVNNPSLGAANEQKIGESYRIDQATMSNIAKLMPDIFSSNGGIDVYSAASRAQRLKNKWDKEYYDILNSSEAYTAGGAEGDPFQGMGFINNGRTVKKDVRERGKDTATALAEWFSSPHGSLQGGGSGSTGNADEGAGQPPAGGSDAEISPKKVDDKGNVTTDGDNGDGKSSLGSYFQSEWDDGTAFASFRVDYTGPISESFSNTTQQSDLQQKFNSTSATARSARFSFADGNVAGILGGVKDAVTGFVGGITDQLHISGLMSLGGSAFVDIPEHWENSTASLPKSTYTITLISPYGNPISQITNIYVPLAMLLTGALPLATGKQSYTSPFLVELYDRGRSQTRLGMIDSMTITRGTSNLGFNQDANAMAIEVSFSVKDLSSVMTMPVAQGFSWNLLQGVTDDENIYTDYIATLSSLSMPQQFYQLNKFKLNVAKKLRSFHMLSSPARWMALAHEYTPVGLLDILFRGTERR